MHLTAPTNNKWQQLMHRGLKRFRQKRFKEAIAAFNKAVKIRPGQAESWSNLGAVQLEAGHYRAAENSLRKSISLDSSLMQAHLNLGDVLRKLNQAPESVAAYTTALELHRSPNSLNKMACALRQINKAEAAESLYLEAIRLQPNFNIARVNLATVQLELGRFPQALKQLDTLQQQPLTTTEQKEVSSVRQALSEYLRIDPAIESLLQGNNHALKEALQATAEEELLVDPKIANKLTAYAASASIIEATTAVDTSTHLGTRWAQVEAMFMIPMVETAAEFYAEIAQIQSQALTTEQQETFNMIAVVSAVCSSQVDLADPVLAEVHLRCWHALACRGLPTFLPGHFKTTTNLTLRDQVTHRAEPHLVAGSFRYFIQHIYTQLEPGLPRALLCWMAVCDIHPFTDANGRVGMAWLNRELEWAGLDPCLFTRSLGLQGQLARVMHEVRKKDDISLLIPTIEQAQQVARDFCAELNKTN